MIYNKNTTQEYRLKFYQDLRTGQSPVSRYINGLGKKDKSKILKYIEFLRTRRGYLEEPYSRHIQGKIRELRVDFGKNKHRIFYFVFIGKTIIMLHAFLKKTKKTPRAEIRMAQDYYQNILKNPKRYE